MTGRIDWAAVMAQLRERGMSYPQLHRATSIPVGTLYNLANNLSQEPGHMGGERLLQLLREVGKPEAGRIEC